ncbi:MAG: SDR family oxidoreductase [Elusimicrobia bacterium]|jgi:nucleoside-diphosphate-sugar epimerase|nr:SDR family oxidoreductase [Elusimicrobiota bacterium]
MNDNKKNVYLVTGGAGFIGSHITEELVKRGEKVMVVDNFSTGSRDNLKGFIDDIELTEGDIRDPELINRLCAKCDIILHQAALRSVPRSVDDPSATNDVNINGTLNLLIDAKDNGVKKVVYASSSSAYGDTKALPKKESQRPLPISPYAVSKLTGEHYCRAFSSTYGLETVALRYFNVIGPRQSPESKYAAVVPIFIKQALNDIPLTIHGDGKQSRDFTYVKNVVNGNLLAAEAEGVSGEVFNIACNNRHSVLEIASEIFKNLGKKVPLEHLPRRAGDVEHTQADISKAKKMLGYEVEVDFKEGMKKTVESYNA